MFCRNMLILIFTELHALSQQIHSLKSAKPVILLVLDVIFMVWLAIVLSRSHQSVLIRADVVHI